MQDTQAGLSQILATTTGGTTTTSIYGLQRLATRTNTAYEWYFTDHLGSVRMQLDHSGTPNPAMSYDAFGNPAATLESPFGFTGELHAADTGLVHLRARWYTPATGTLIGRDPFDGYPTMPYSLHPYQYGYSSPLMFTDPSGMCVSGDTLCWTTYDSAIEKLGFTPAGLSNWGSTDLAYLLTWLEKGVTFFPKISENIFIPCIPPFLKEPISYGGWSAVRIGYALEAIRRVEQVVGTDKTTRLLGLNITPLIFFITPGREDDGGIGGSYNKSYNKIRMFLPTVVGNKEFPIETFLHEMGHSLSHRSGDFAASNTWLMATGRDINDPTQISATGARGVISTYALVSHAEDFADTFKWHIEYYSGNTIDNYKYEVPSNKQGAYNAGRAIAPDQSRQDALMDLIDTF